MRDFKITIFRMITALLNVRVVNILAYTAM